MYAKKSHYNIYWFQIYLLVASTHLWSQVCPLESHRISPSHTRDIPISENKLSCPLMPFLLQLDRPIPPSLIYMTWFVWKAFLFCLPVCLHAGLWAPRRTKISKSQRGQMVQSRKKHLSFKIPSGQEGPGIPGKGLNSGLQPAGIWGVRSLSKVYISFP